MSSAPSLLYSAKEKVTALVAVRAKARFSKCEQQALQAKQRFFQLPKATPSPAYRRWGERRAFMEQNQNNYITLELNLKLQMKDYRIVLGIKRAWIIAIVVALTQFIVWLVKDRP